MIIKTENLTKDYETGTQVVSALKGINLSVEKGEFLSIMGPSGSGKTTLMNIIGCLDSPTNGSYYLNNKSVSKLDDDELAKIRNEEIGFVFQSFHLLARNTAFDNVMLPLKYAGVSKEEATKRSNNVLDLVGLSSRSKHTPAELSGGQQQRVALARALAPEPDLILLDEPFTRLDIRLKEKLRDEILHLLKKAGSTALIVTHEAEEAMFMSDKIVVINEGKVMQIGRPGELYTRPISKFVAEFFGEVNYLSGISLNGKIKTKLGDFPAIHIKDGLKTHIIIRHEGIKLEDNYSKNLPKAKVLQSRLLGRFSLVHLQVGEGNDKVHLHARVPGLSYLKPETIIGIEIDPVQTYVFT